MISTNRTQRAFGYVRVSDESQIEGHSLGEQEHQIRAHCTAKGFEFLRIYRDEGISGRYDEIAKRPGFKAMLEAIGRHEADVVVVHTLDRWARNVLVTLTAFKTLGDAQCAFVSLNENIDYSTPEGRIFLIMLAAFAQYFSDSLGKHASKAKRARARLGLPLGRVPFGYKHDKGKATLVPEEAEALRKLVFEAFLEGHSSFKSLADKMNDAGWFTRSANVMAKQRAAGEEPLGGRWKADTVRFILKNNFYAGWVDDSTSGERVQGQHQAILTDEEFSRIQALLQERRETRVPFASQTQRRPDKFRSYALRGLLRCALCGTTLAGVTNRKKATSAERRRYVFYCGKRGVACQATHDRNTHSIDAKKLELDAEEVAEALASHYGVDLDAALLPADERESRLGEIARLEERKRRARVVFESGEYTDLEYAERLADLNGAIRRLQPQVSTELTEAKVRLKLLREFPWLGASAEAKACVFQDLFEALFVDPTTNRIVAVSPRPAYRPFAEESALVERIPSGWLVGIDGRPDYESPDDWRIEFKAMAEDASASSAMGGSHGAGDEALSHLFHPTPYKRWNPYRIRGIPPSIAGTYAEGLDGLPSLR